MKILVIHASAGAGHLKAAKAIYDGLKKNAFYEVVFADALDYTSPFFKTFYQRTYTFLVTRMPWLWGFFFRLIDLPWIQPLTRICRRIFNSLNARALHTFLKTGNFDYVFTTHFMSNEIVAALKRSGQIRSKLVTVVTDFDVHKIWLSREADFYAVASEWTKQKLLRLGVAEHKIRVTGIPVDEKFARPAERGGRKQKLGIKENVFTVLVATGSFGTGPIAEILRILEPEGDVQTLAVCGHNRRLFQQLSRQNYQGAKILGLVDNMHELMAVADVIVTKPGGLSIAEALVSRLPMIFFHPIPGQETNNVRVLREHGIGSMPADIRGITEELKKLKSSSRRPRGSLREEPTGRDTYLTALKQTHRLARPLAVRDIIALVS